MFFRARGRCVVHCACVRAWARRRVSVCVRQSYRRTATKRFSDTWRIAHPLGWLPALSAVGNILRLRSRVRIVRLIARLRSRVRSFPGPLAFRPARPFAAPGRARLSHSRRGAAKGGPQAVSQAMLRGGALLPTRPVAPLHRRRPRPPRRVSESPIASLPAGFSSSPRRAFCKPRRAHAHSESPNAHSESPKRRLFKPSLSLEARMRTPSLRTRTPSRVLRVSEKKALSLRQAYAYSESPNLQVAPPGSLSVVSSPVSLPLSVQHAHPAHVRASESVRARTD